MIHRSLKVPEKAIAEFCGRHRIRTLALFGSVTRDDFGPGSDVDVLVEFEPDAGPTLFDMVEMQQELSRLLGRPVDLLERHSVEQSRNYIRRKHILSSLEPLYVAG